MAKVSLIVPVYNAEPWIEECMASIHAQTYKDIEIIVVNDGSTDNSSSRIDRKDSRVSISHTVHRGAAAARNTGIDLSTGEYIAFCDADDYLAPDAIEKMVAAMDGVDMVCGSFRKFGTFEQVVSEKSASMRRKDVATYAMGNMLNPRANQMLSGCWAKLYRSNMVGRFPPITTAEDMAFNFDYLRLCFRDVRFISDVVYSNRKHEGTLSTTFNPDDRKGLFGFMEGLKYVERFVRENLKQGISADEITDAIDNSKAYHSMLYFTRIMQQTGESPRDTLMRLYA